MKMQRPISLTEKMNFVNNLAIMLGAGLSINKALSVLHKQSRNQRFQKVILGIKKNIQSGQTLTDSLSLHPNVFSSFHISMIQVGETGGSLEKVLKELSRQMKQSHDLRSKIKGALIYPIAILIVMLIMSVIMIMFVIPKMIVIFEQFNAKLPLITRIIINSSRFLIGHSEVLWIAIGLLLALIIVFIKKWRHQSWFYKILIKLPIFGRINRQFNSALMARNLSSLLSSGVPIVKALNTTANTLPNSLFKASLIKTATEVQKGASINSIIQQYPKLYSPTILQIIEVGETSGQLSQMLEQLAGFYENEIDQTTKNLSSIIEPALIVLIGIAVGIFAVAMLQPMYSLLQSV